MPPVVYILATVRNPALLEAALLVFKTLRTGFPTARVHVHGNAIEPFLENEVARAAQKAGAIFTRTVRRIAHDEWIEELVLGAAQPIWVVDTDVVFFDAVETFELDRQAAAAGRLEPEFLEEWTQSTHVERLHTSCLWLNAPRIRAAGRQWMGRFPAIWHTAQMNLIRQQFIPVAGQEPLFYDTCAGMYQALGGQAFTPEQDQAFEHLHCATYSDLITPAVPSLADLARVHKEIYSNPSLARGLLREQSKYYEQRKGNRLCHTLQESKAP